MVVCIACAIRVAGLFVAQKLPRLSRLHGGHAPKDKNHDLPDSLCRGSYQPCLPDIRVVLMARVSGVQPDFQSAQPQTADLDKNNSNPAGINQR